MRIVIMPFHLEQGVKISINITQGVNAHIPTFVAFTIERTPEYFSLPLASRMRVRRWNALVLPGGWRQAASLPIIMQLRDGAQHENYASVAA